MSWESRLMNAAEHGHEKIAEFCYFTGGVRRADVIDKAFIEASSRGHERLARMFGEWNLIGNKAVITALFSSIRNGRTEVVKFIVEEYKDAIDLNDALVEATYEGNEELVVYFLSNGADAVNEALLEASCQGNARLVRLLVLGYEASNLDEAEEEARENGHISLSREISEYAIFYTPLGIPCM